jgi:hypothetical protein
MTDSQAMYSYIVAGIAIIIVLGFAMRLRRSIQRDNARQTRRERFKPGPALGRRRYTIRGSLAPGESQSLPPRRDTDSISE